MFQATFSILLEWIVAVLNFLEKEVLHAYDKFNKAFLIYAITFSTVD